MTTLASARVAVFGLGGVGGYAVEALARSGIGALDLVDNDKICPTNLNRQILATRSTMGQMKTQAAKDRILDINPTCRVTTYNLFFTPDTADEIPFADFDYVVDAIDTVTGKIELVLRCRNANVPIISCMGTGNKLHPELLEVADIYDTSVCPLAKVMRHELRKRNVDHLKVVYSKETPIPPRVSPAQDHAPEELSRSADSSASEGTPRRQVPGSTAFVPPTAGLLLASEIVRDLTEGLR